MLEPLQPVAILGEHPPLDCVGKPTESIKLEVEQVGRVVERLAAFDGDDEVHAGMDSEPAAEESRFSVSLSVAVALHADDRGRVSATLASQWQVAEEGVLGDAMTAKQELPRDISDAPTGAARSPQMTVALSSRLSDRPGPPIPIGWLHFLAPQKWLRTLVLH
jgi:hypothetical protein